MATGIVKWFNDAKGFGFIEPDGGGSDIFAHFSAIAMDGFKTLKQGARVTFEVADGPKGQLARNIQAQGQSFEKPIETRPADQAPSGERGERSERTDRPGRHSKVRAPQFHASSHAEHR